MRLQGQVAARDVKTENGLTDPIAGVLTTGVQAIAIETDWRCYAREKLGSKRD
jgi:hypothetical protein